MSLSYRLNKGKLALPVLALCLLTQGAAFAQTDDQSYSGGTPVKPGTITLQQVIEAHQGLPETTIQSPLTPPQPVQPLTTPQMGSAVGDMLMQGMESDLQEQQVQRAQPAQLSAPKLRSPQLLNAIPAAAPTAPTLAAPSSGAASASPMMAPAAAPEVSPTLPAPPQMQATPGCTPHVETWVRKCTDAGYPDEFVGEIKGETRTTCPAGALQDVWLSNSCAPPDEAKSASTAPAAASALVPSVVQPTAVVISTSNTVDAMCGTANGVAVSETPAGDLCARGMASRVNGSGPWTWACSGIDGGKAAACSAPRGTDVVTTVKKDAICGLASSVKHKNTPASGLCSVGIPSSVSGNGPWLWTCDGLNDGASVSCSADVSADAAEEQPVPVPTPLPPMSAAETPPAPATEAAPAAAEDMAASTQAAEPLPTTSVISASDTFTRHETSLCGTASELAAFEAPSRDLCRAGTPGTVTGAGPWEWTCSDQNGHTANCATLTPGSFKTAAMPTAAEAAAAATAMPTPASASNSMCGAAAGQGVEEKPTDELCATGKHTTVRGKGPWTWSCIKGKKKEVCNAPKLIDGVCGKANGSVRKGAPASDLCKAGTATPIQGEGPWLWSCVGTGGGISVSCSAATQSQTKLDGACGVAAATTMTTQPTSSLCDSGIASTVMGAGPWTWTCSGSNGGSPTACSTQKTGMVVPPAPMGPPVNGLCGSSNGAAVFSTPTAGLCDAGSTSLVKGNGPWTWTCSGSNGGITVSCTALSMSSSLSTSHLAPAAPNETGLAAPSNSSFPAPPTPSQVPTSPGVNAGESPPSATAPALPGDAQALTPPPVSATLVPTPGLKPNGTGRDVAPLTNTSFTLDQEFSTIPFNRGDENIDPAELPTLDKLADVLVNNGSVRITLTAYADAGDSSPREARRLSLTRALAVRDYLTAKGVSSSRIDVRALGANVPSGDADRIDVKVE